eukprot:1738494-Pleurochrysis_carterae.AAC.1
MDHWQSFAAIYAGGGICGMSPATRSNASNRQLCFRWCRPVATNLKSMIYTGSATGAILSPLSPANDVSSANHHPFPGDEPTTTGFDPNHQITAPEVVITHAIGSRHFEARMIPVMVSKVTRRSQSEAGECFAGPTPSRSRSALAGASAALGD